MASTLKRIEPLMAYKGAGDWRNEDPESGTVVQEEATDTIRTFLWRTQGKNISITTVVNPTPRIIQNCPGDLSNRQQRKDGGWQDMYVDEIIP